MHQVSNNIYKNESLFTSITHAGKATAMQSSDQNMSDIKKETFEPH